MLEHTSFPAPSAQPLQVIIRRSSMPLLLFSVVLFILLVISYATLLPQFTQVHRPDGTAMSPQEIAKYRQTLTAQLATEEAERVKLVSAVADDTYTELKNNKRERISLMELREELAQAASRLGEKEGSVVLVKVGMDAETVTLEGDITNVGTRSMTVLAAFVDQLEKLSFVKDLQRPAFTREQKADGSFHSPFLLRFTLAQ